MKKQITLFFVLVLLPIITMAQHIGTGLGYHTIAVKSNSTVYTWGYNSDGQLGNNSTKSSKVPVGVTSGITHVATGYYHSIALASDSTVYTWGNNMFGQLGNNSTADSHVPVAVSTSGVLSGKIITQVAAGGYHSIVLDSNGTVYTWGYNGNGRLGNNSTTQSNVPVAVVTSGTPMAGKQITQVAAGDWNSIALAADGTVYTWGNNTYGQLGNGNTGTESHVPVAVSTSGVLSGKQITQVAGGGSHFIALASDRTVYTWGHNTYGGLGNGNNTDYNVPVAVVTSGTPMAGKTITQVAGGNSHSIALASDGTVYTWGDNSYGQLGNASTTHSNIPVAVSGALSGKTITQVACGRFHSIALTSDGTVYTWGRNDDGQLGNNDPDLHDSYVPVAVDQSVMGPLPVELTSFSANILTNGIELNWQTATEINNYGFEIERCVAQISNLCNNWEVVGFVEGHGNSNSPKDYTFTDTQTFEVLKNLEGFNGVIQYRLKQIDIDGNYEYSDVVEVTLNNKAPDKFGLSQNYPNPFNPSTKISWQSPLEAHQVLKVYDVLGNEVATLVNEYKPAGNYEVQFDASGLSSGVYIYQIEIYSDKLQTGNYTQTRKMILLR